jgi:hypothetical protein
VQHDTAVAAVAHTIQLAIAPARFVAAMIALFVGLLSFLREIVIATANLRISPQ